MAMSYTFPSARNVVLFENIQTTFKGGLFALVFSSFAYYLFQI